jgi:DNA-binding transcriptional regulator GbsR (MarR family)
MTLADEIEAVLTIADRPMTISQLSKILGKSNSHLSRSLNKLRAQRAVKTSYIRVCYSKNGRARGRGANLWMLA